MSVICSRKACATCEFWSGERENKFDHSVSIKDIQKEGICTNPKSSFKKKMTQYSYHCLKWDKWAALTKMK